MYTYKTKETKYKTKETKYKAKENYSPQKSSAKEAYLALHIDPAVGDDGEEDVGDFVVQKIDVVYVQHAAVCAG